MSAVVYVTVGDETGLFSQGPAPICITSWCLYPSALIKNFNISRVRRGGRLTGAINEEKRNYNKMNAAVSSLWVSGRAIKTRRIRCNLIEFIKNGAGPHKFRHFSKNESPATFTNLEEERSHRSSSKTELKTLQQPRRKNTSPASSCLISAFAISTPINLIWN